MCLQFQLDRMCKVARLEYVSKQWALENVEKTKVKMFLISIEFILVISNNLLLMIWSLTIFSCTLWFWYCYLTFYFWLLINTPSNIHSQKLIDILEWYFSSTFSINLWESTFEPFISWDIRSRPILE